MTDGETRREMRRRPPRRRRPQRLRIALALVGALLVLALGVALGRALEDGPPPSGTVTYVRTLEPLPQTEAG